MTTSNCALSSALSGTAAHFRSLLASPVSVQAEHLNRIVQRNTGSAFGREHAFRSIHDAADFSRRVPLFDYESLSPWIERAASGEPRVLTAEPVFAFEETGGSSSGHKLVPYTASGLREFQAGLRPWLDDLFMSVPMLNRGCFYWAISPACRPSRRTSGDIPIGVASDALYFGEELIPHVVGTLAVGTEVAGIADIAQWRVHTLVQLLAREDLVMISVWSPTFLTQLLDAAVLCRDSLAEAMTRGGVASADRVKLALDSLAASPPAYERLWPRLSVISCWDQASSAPHASVVRETFPNAIVQGKGLLATEGLFTIPLHDYPWPVLSLASGYFEFRGDDGQVGGVADVCDGREYELIVTNANGFYRYAIGDHVRVRGFVGRTPMLEFLGRGPGRADLCGEKLTEPFVLRALAPLGVRFSALAVDPAARCYVMILDAEEVPEAAAAGMLARVERGLDQNPQYAYARRLRQLNSLVLQRIHRPVSRWTAARVARGQRLGDIKPPVLLDEADLRTMLQP